MVLRKFAKVTAREVLENFQSDSEYGLSNAAIASLKKIHGVNKIAEEEKVLNLRLSSLFFLLYVDITILRSILCCDISSISKIL